MDMLWTGFFGSAGSVLTKLSISDNILYFPLIILSNLMMFHYNTRSLQRNPTVKVSVLVFTFNLVFTTLFGVLLFNEKVTAKFLIGFAFILLGSLQFINKN
jgi:drug/metabolite transporter (DMT)-like permease